MDDGLNKSKKSLERQASKLKELASGTGHHKESDSAEGYIEHLLVRIMFDCLLRKLTLCSIPEFTKVFNMQTQLPKHGHHEVHAQ